MRLSYGKLISVMTGVLLLAVSCSCQPSAEARVQNFGNGDLVDLNQGRVIKAVDQRLSDRVSIVRHINFDDDGGGFVNPIDPGNGGNPGGGNPGGGNPGSGSSGAGNVIGNTAQTSIINFTVQGGLNAVGGSSGTSSLGSGDATTISFAHPKNSDGQNDDRLSSNFSPKQSGDSLAGDSLVIQLSNVIRVAGVSDQSLSVQDFISSAVNTNGMVNMTVANQLLPATNVLMTQDSLPDTAGSRVQTDAPLNSSQNTLDPIRGQGFTVTAFGPIHSNDLEEIENQLK